MKANSKFLWASDIFSELLFEIGKFRLKRPREAPDDETRHEAQFPNKFMVEKFLRMTQKFGN